MAGRYCNEYNTDHAILDVAELDGLLTAVSTLRKRLNRHSGWLPCGVGLTLCRAGRREKEMTRFMNLAFQHMADTAERLKTDSRSSLSRYSACENLMGVGLTIGEEWCFSTMRGVSTF
ncbi:UPF0149 family protein [Shigella boydii]